MEPSYLIASLVLTAMALLLGIGGLILAHEVPLVTVFVLSIAVFLMVAAISAGEE